MTYPETITDDPTRKVKLNALEFDGRLESAAFVDWLDEMDEYFEWYNMYDAQHISVARIKLVGNANIFGKQLCVMLTLGVVHQFYHEIKWEIYWRKNMF